jgi:uncharacterized protein YdhG (YjbR/CyaY superfamily)
LHTAGLAAAGGPFDHSQTDEVSMKERKAGQESTASSAGKSTRKRAASRAGGDAAAAGFSADERAAMKERARELRAESRGGGRAKKEDGEGDVLAKIAEMEGSDRAMAERLHALVKASAPELTPRTWYGMPAYAKDGKVICFFQSAQKFKARYATFGFSDAAKLDEGASWPVAFALKELTPAEEARIGALVKRAAS